MRSLVRLLKAFKMFMSFLLLNLKYRHKTIDSIIKDGIQYELFITNNLGGGTRTFRNNYLAEKRNVVILYNKTYGTDFCFVLENLDTKDICIIQKKLLRKVIHHNQIIKISVNTLITYKCCEWVLNELYHQGKSTPIVYFVHDFYCICPVYTLIKNDVFCQLNCNQTDVCMSKNNPFLISCSSIKDWRVSWNKFLQVCTEIRCFSSSSKELVLSAYPAMPQNKVTVVPHDMSWCSLESIAKIGALPLHIGFIGDVHTIPKGRKIVRELLRKLDKEIPVTFIGNSWFQLPSTRKNVCYLGSYKHAELQMLVEKQNISTVVFPSICSETFSYAVSEHIMMGLDVLCFDIGAQAEKVKNYNHGYVCTSVDEMISILHEMKKRKGFFRRNS